VAKVGSQRRTILTISSTLAASETSISSVVRADRSAACYLRFFTRRNDQARDEPEPHAHDLRCPLSTLHPSVPTSCFFHLQAAVIPLTALVIACGGACRATSPARPRPCLKASTDPTSSFKALFPAAIL